MTLAISDILLLIDANVRYKATVTIVLFFDTSNFAIALVDANIAYKATGTILLLLSTWNTKQQLYNFLLFVDPNVIQSKSYKFAVF